jgi:hypothetical protein
MHDAEHLRMDAVGHGADPHDVNEAIAALRTPEHPVWSAVIDIAVYGPGHGALVDARFVRRQRRWSGDQL